MADINLEKKGRSGIWGWVIALIVLLIILWAIFGHRTRPATNTSSTGLSATPASLAAGPALSQWLGSAA